MKTAWDPDVVARELGEYVDEFRIDTVSHVSTSQGAPAHHHYIQIFTFDDKGVSSHPNHIACYEGARRLLAQRSSASLELAMSSDLSPTTSHTLVTSPAIIPPDGSAMPADAALDELPSDDERKDRYQGIFSAKPAPSDIKPVLAKDLTVYTLQTVGVGRKYASFIEALFFAPLSWMPLPPASSVDHRPSRVLFLAGSPARYVTALKAMSEHQSQMVWFRYLYVQWSSYLWVGWWTKMEA